MVLSDKVVLFQNTLWVDARGKYPTMLGFRLSTLCFTSRGRLLRCPILDPLLPCHFDLHLDNLRESSINEFMLVKNILPKPNTFKKCLSRSDTPPKWFFSKVRHRKCPPEIDRFQEIQDSKAGGGGTRIEHVYCL